MEVKKALCKFLSPKRTESEYVMNITDHNKIKAAEKTNKRGGGDKLINRILKRYRNYPVRKM